MGQTEFINAYLTILVTSVLALALLWGFYLYLSKDDE